VGWSWDGGTLYLMESDGHPRLSSFDLAKGTERLLHEYPRDAKLYAEPLVDSGRLYPSRDGKGLLGTRFFVRSSVWLLEGVEPPRGFWSRLVK
jgi:hypothetical protein